MEFRAHLTVLYAMSCPFHACGFAEILANDLILMVDSKQNSCLSGVPSPLMADFEPNSSLSGVPDPF